MAWARIRALRLDDLCREAVGRFGDDLQREGPLARVAQQHWEYYVKMKFAEEFDTPNSVAKLIGTSGEWRQGENHYQYRANTGAVLNW
jgi:hypothetical protein